MSVSPLPAPPAEAVRIRTALLSVSDKTGLAALTHILAGHGVRLLSTGGTYALLKKEGIAVEDVSAYTGFPEIMDGRVKTLHPKVHGGLLGRRDIEGHRAAMNENGIEGIDLVIVNLYPFAATVAAGGDFDACIENIDIGGPAMIRAAAKNHAFVTIVTDPKDYAALADELAAHDGATTPDLRRRLAASAFALTAFYDAQISRWFAQQPGQPQWPARISFAGQLANGLRYGENPHQQAALYTDDTNRIGVTTAHQLQGKELSYNNLNDTDAAFELVAEFDAPAVAIIKHANPCGVASGEVPLPELYRRALSCDPVSAFGGIIALNRALDAETATEITKIFSEVIIAPSVEDAALPILAKKANLRVLTTGGLPNVADRRLTIRTISGGYLIQDADTGRVGNGDLKVVTKRAPTDAELADLLFAFRVGKHVKSNAIVYAKDGTTTGIGAGQMSRLDSSRIAARKAEDAAASAGWSEPRTRGSVVASDAFFPFADGLIAAADAGVTAIIQPGGSMRDQDVIDAADARGLAMVFTGMRHFRH